MIFYEALCHEFSMFWNAHIFFSFIVVCIHLRFYITSDVHFIMCGLREKTQSKDLVNQKMMEVILSSMFFLCISLFG